MELISCPLICTLHLYTAPPCMFLFQLGRVLVCILVNSQMGTCSVMIYRTVGRTDPGSRRDDIQGSISTCRSINWSCPNIGRCMSITQYQVQVGRCTVQVNSMLRNHKENIKYYSISWRYIYIYIYIQPRSIYLYVLKVGRY